MGAIVASCSIFTVGYALLSLYDFDSFGQLEKVDFVGNLIEMINMSSN